MAFIFGLVLRGDLKFCLQQSCSAWIWRQLFHHGDAKVGGKGIVTQWGCRIKQNWLHELIEGTNLETPRPWGFSCRWLLPSALDLFCFHYQQCVWLSFAIILNGPIATKTLGFLTENVLTKFSFIYTYIRICIYLYIYIYATVRSSFWHSSRKIDVVRYLKNNVFW